MALPPLSQAFVTFLNINFYTLISPFKLQFQPNSGIVVPIRARGCHKALFFMTWAGAGLVLTFIILNMPPSDPVDQSNSLEMAIRILTNIGWTLLNLIVKVEIWKGPQKFAGLASKLLHVETEMMRMRIHPCWMFKYPVTLAVFLYVLSLTINVWEVAANSPRWVKNMSVIISESEVMRPSAAANVILGFKIYENQVKSFGAMSVLMLSLILFVITRSYHSYFKANCGQNGGKVPSACKLMVELSSEIKGSFGCTVGGVMLLLLSYYSQRIQDIFSGSAPMIARYCYYMGRLVSTLFLGAQAHAQFQAILRPWISADGESLENVKNIKMKTILMDVLQRDGFGIRGRVLCVTYTCFGSIMAAILAYSIAIVQLQ